MPGHEQLVTILDPEGHPAAVDPSGQVLAAGQIRPGRSPAPAGDRLSQGPRRRWISGRNGQGLRMVSRDITGGCPDTSSW
ncbi:MAG TPA: hypothetical protein PLO63_11605 [Syntrophales bacterium]|nr:hypothetical protein [Syntrophales bacterium]